MNNLEETEIENELKNKNLIVGKFLLDSVKNLLSLISDYHLPYSLELKFDPENPEIDRYMANHFRKRS